MARSDRRDERPAQPQDGVRTSGGRERLAQARAEQASAARRRVIALVAGAVVLVLLITAGVVWAVKNRSDSPTDTGADSSQISGMKTWSNLGRDHVEGDPTFPMTPPVGGNHNAVWANCGIYDKTIPNKYAVHSLEHGAVWITTDGVSSGDLAKLKKLAGQDYMLMSTYPKQGSPIVVSAWGHQIRATSASDPRIEQFIKAFLQGPQTPEPGAACSGGYDPNTGKIAGGM